VGATPLRRICHRHAALRRALALTRASRAQVSEPLAAVAAAVKEDPFQSQARAGAACLTSNRLLIAASTQPTGG
jgi:hypothetical protein